jgi:hypothetical protein
MVDELIQFSVVEIGNGPEGHAVAYPVPDLEAAEHHRVGQASSVAKTGLLRKLFPE